MNPKLKQLLIGLAKTATLTITAVITGFPTIDPDHFNFISRSGALHMAGAVGWLVIVHEAQFLTQWINGINGNGSGKTGGGTGGIIQ